VGRERYSREQQEYYRKYLSGPDWRARKQARMVAAGHRCEWYTAGVRCGRRTRLCVHHNTYERLGAENDADLDVYCWPHHMLEHCMWVKCQRCQDPCLEDATRAEHWLRIVLGVLGIDQDALPAWTNLPNKEVLMTQVPAVCSSCENYLLERGMNWANS
jgi:hypothetical protein